MRDPHDSHLLTCAGMALNNHEVHPERAELLLGAAGAAAAGSPAACAARRRVDSWCSRADGPRATRTSPQVTIPGTFGIYVRSTEQIVVQRSSDRLLVCVRAVVSLSLFGVPVASESWWVCGVRAWLVVILFSLYPLLLL